jgi:hypothetical protein
MNATALETLNYLLRWCRVRRSIFLCFFFRMRFLRFLISEPIRRATLSAVARRATRDTVALTKFSDRHRPAAVSVRGRLMVGQRFLEPPVGVRILPPER